MPMYYIIIGKIHFILHYIHSSCLTVDYKTQIFPKLYIFEFIHIIILIVIAFIHSTDSEYKASDWQINNQGIKGIE